MLIRGSRRRYRPIVAPVGYTALKSEDWSTYLTKTDVLTAWDGADDKLLGDYFSGYANSGLLKADMYELVTGTPWPGGQGVRMIHPCGNELSTPTPGPETGGPHALTTWTTTLTGPNGFHRWSLGATYAEVVYRTRYRLSSASDNPLNGISAGYTDNHDEPAANGKAQKMHHLQYVGGTDVGTGGFRTETVNNGHRITTNFSGTFWNETVTRYGAASGIVVAQYPWPVTSDPTNHRDGYLDALCWFKRVSDTECWHAVLIHATHAKNGNAVSTPWDGYRVNSTRKNAPTQSPLGIDQCQSHQNRNGRVSPGTQSIVMGPTEVIVGAYDCAALFDVLGAPGYVA